MELVAKADTVTRDNTSCNHTFVTWDSILHCLNPKSNTILHVILYHTIIIIVIVHLMLI